MIIYFSLIFVATILYLVILPDESERRRKVYMGLMFVFFLLCFGLRDFTVGADTEEYYYYFTTIRENSLSWSIENLRYEAGFIAFCKAVSLLGRDPQLLIFFSGLVILIGCFNFICKSSKNCYVSILLFVFLNYFFMYMSAMRQAVAISIILIGYEQFLKKNKKVRFLLTVLLACTFHDAAVVSVLLMFMPKKISYGKREFVLTVVCSALAFVFGKQIFSVLAITSNYDYYMNTVFSTGNEIASYVNYIVYLVILIFAAVFGNSITENREYNSYLYILSMNLIFYALTARVSIFVRITTYFDVFNCVYLTHTVRNIKDEGNRKLINLSFYPLLAFYWIIVCVFRPDWYGCVPYKFFW